MNENVPICLSSLIEESKDGEWGKGEAIPNYLKMLVIRGTDFEKVKSGNIIGIPKRFIPVSIAKRKRLYSNDIIIETAGGTEDTPTGRVVFISEEFLKRNKSYDFTCASFSRFIRIDKEKANPLFVYWYLQFLYNARISYMFHTQHTGVARFQWTKFSNYKLFLLPNLLSQKRIASFLNAYDELIEVNNQRIRVQQEVISELYKEWFARMRFPGHKQAKFVKGVPEGWSVKKVKDIVNRRKFGKTYKHEELSEQGNVIVIDQSTDAQLGFHNNEPDHIATSENPIIIFGDHTCKMQLMIEPFSLAENVIPISSTDKIPIYYLYFLIESLVETTEYKRHWNELVTKSVFVCQTELQKRYAEIVKPFFEQIEILKQQNTQLRQIRDRLLPRLISGKLELKQSLVI